MKKNDIIELDITGMTHEGLGVGRRNGMAVFVQGAILGEKVYARIIKVQKNYAVARAEGWLNKSQHRQEPFCPVYKWCGGCSLQHMSYQMQLEFKHGVVKDALAHIGGFKDITVNPVIGMDNPMHYRNKAQYPVGIGKDTNRCQVSIQIEAMKLSIVKAVQYRMRLALKYAILLLKPSVKPEYPHMMKPPGKAYFAKL